MPTALRPFALLLMSGSIAVIPAACLPAKDDADDRPGTDTDPVAACTGVRFAAAPVTWSLPDGCDENDEDGSPACRFTSHNYVDRTGNATYYSVFDLDGDHALDFVVTYDTEAGADIGRDRWTVHPGGESGFGGASAWSLPEGCDENDEDGSPACRFVSHSYTDRTGNLTYYSVFDLDADGAPDFVTTYDTEAGADVGREHWSVHSGSGSGFGDAATWSLPDGCDENDEDGSPACRFVSHNYTDRTGNDTYYSVFDLDGDGALDFVTTYDTESGADVGREHWSVHSGVGGGFGDAATWRLPDGCDENDEDGLPACRFVSHNYVDRTGNPTYYSLLDLDADGTLDFVTTYDTEASEDVGREHWSWHPGGDDGFGAAASWRLPDGCDENDEDGSPACRFTSHNYVDRSGDATYFATFDLDGNNVPDFVATYDTEAGAEVGREKWTVHPGGEAGFEDATSWELPAGCDENDGDGSPACRFVSHNYTDRNDAATYYTLLDIDGDALLDFVVTYDTEAGSEVGRDHWLVYRGACAH